MSDQMILDTSSETHPTSSEEETVFLDLPLVIDGDDSNFEDIVATSKALPVLLLLWSPRSLESTQVSAFMEELAREHAGEFQLARINADTCASIVQALRVQQLPTLLALVAARPISMAEGPVTKEQVRSVLPQLREVAAQLGANARIKVDEADTQEPTPEEHLAPLAAEEEGNLEEAVALWEKVIDLNPRDEAAKSQCARVRLLLRSRGNELGDELPAEPEQRADALLASGQSARAFDVLLDVLATSTQQEERDRVRLHLLDLFRVAGPTDEVRSARKRLTTLLMI